MFSRLFARAMRHYPLHSPRASLLGILPPIPDAYGEFVGKRGLRYRSVWQTSDPIGLSLYWFGDFDPWVNEALARLATPGSTALDMGANIGATATVLANAVGPGGRVFCFEPMPGNASKLRDNLAANNFGWASVEQIALSDDAGEVLMEEAYGWAGAARIANSGTKVQAITFDQWLASTPLTEVAVCKIDVEGHEEALFSGMAKALQNKLIRSFVVERHDVDLQRPLQDAILSLLNRHGYEIFRIEKGLASTHFRSIKDDPKATPTTDFIAALPDAAALL